MTMMEIVKLDRKLPRRPFVPRLSDPLWAGIRDIRSGDGKAILTFGREQDKS